MHPNRQYICQSLRCSWSIACRRCSNYIFILNLTAGFKGFRKDSRKAVQGSFKGWDLVRLILETWRYNENSIVAMGSWCPKSSKVATSEPHWYPLISSHVQMAVMYVYTLYIPTRHVHVYLTGLVGFRVLPLFNIKSAFSSIRDSHYKDNGGLYHGNAYTGNRGFLYDPLNLRSWSKSAIFPLPK